MHFQENLIQLRKEAGYSARSFAEKLNIPYTTYLAYEKTDREPKYTLLIKIADILKVSIDDLLRRTQSHENDDIKKYTNIVLSYLNTNNINFKFCLFKITSRDVLFHILNSKNEKLLTVKVKKDYILTDLKTIKHSATWTFYRELEFSQSIMFLDAIADKLHSLSYEPTNIKNDYLDLMMKIALLKEKSYKDYTRYKKHNDYFEENK